MKFLAETALLTHGLPSCTEAELLAREADFGAELVWLERGCLRVGSLREYLPLRRDSANTARVDGAQWEQARQQGLTAALTAGGTMCAAAELGIPLVVTCGMGGIGGAKADRVCSDMPALRDLPVSLLATAPKDVLHAAETMDWFARAGVRVLGTAGAENNGFLFRLPAIPLAGRWHPGEEILPHSLLLQPIPLSARLGDRAMLTRAAKEAAAAAAAGGRFHPAVNASLDAQTRGDSSRMQLEAFCRNLRLARQL